MTAAYAFDFADRESTLQVTSPAGITSVVTVSAYLPSGPPTSLTLGNGATETRAFTSRYFPASIALDATRDRSYAYTTDAVGNVTAIGETVECLAGVVLDNRTITGSEVHRSCDEVAAGPAVEVAPGGSLTLTAATRVILRDGFSVASGATFTAGTDPDLDGGTWTFDYQDPQYFLTSATGPWGDLAWTYDRIGNRLTETRDGATDLYDYTDNLAGGNTPLLEEIQLAVGGVRTFTYGAAGHLEAVDSAGNVVDFAYDAAGRLASAERAGNATPFAYDGRSYLTAAGAPAGPLGATQPTYSSAGLLHTLTQRVTATDAGTTHHVFHFAGRPVAQLTIDDGAETWRYLTTDHLGTPLVATDSTGAELWAGPFEPFGRDRLAGTNLGASAEDVFLRFPGQWDDEVWLETTRGAEPYYNLHRWLFGTIGRYGSPDPLRSSPNDYAYVDARPTRLVDPIGLLALDPDSCKPFREQPMVGGPGGCCYSQLEEAVKRYEEFFTPGWRRRNPECWNAIAGAATRTGWRSPLGDQAILTPLSCMVAGHRGEVMSCSFEKLRGGVGFGGCGITDPRSGATSFRPQICDQRRCPSPLNVLFHERLHRCGAPPDRMGIVTDAADIARTCVGP